MLVSLSRCIKVLGCVLALVTLSLVTAPTAAAVPEEFDKSSWCTADTHPYLSFAFGTSSYPESDPAWQLRWVPTGAVVASGIADADLTRPNGLLTIALPAGLPAGTYALSVPDSSLPDGALVEAYDCVTVKVSCAKLTFTNPSTLAARVDLYGNTSPEVPLFLPPGRSADVRLEPGPLGWIALPQDATHVDEMGTGEVDVPACAALTATPRPVLSGRSRVGQTLRGDPGLWTPTPVTLTYRWLRDGAPIDGATGPTYVPTKADLGRYLSFRVVGRKTGYTTAVRVSADTPRIKPAS